MSFSAAGLSAEEETAARPPDERKEAGEAEGRQGGLGKRKREELARGPDPAIRKGLENGILYS